MAQNSFYKPNLTISIICQSFAFLELSLGFDSIVSIQRISLIRNISQLGTWLFTLLHGTEVGQDDFGNRYFRQRRSTAGRRERRWVLYVNEPEASTVPPEWHAWLHHTLPAPMGDNSKYHRPWQKPHLPNLTGTQAAYLPPGHSVKGGQRDKATGDYEAWQPE
jgi:NADH:ubiquinone oxidoreductase subunit